MKREIRTVSEKLKSQMTPGEEGIILICLCRFYWALHNRSYLKAKVKLSDNVLYEDVLLFQVLPFAGG